MSAQQLFPFPVARYRLVFQVERAIRLPEYAGSWLRGIFGAALRRITCLTGEPRCDGCMLLRRCPYSILFAAPPPPGEHVVQSFANIPNPYVIEPPPWGERDFPEGAELLFHLVLVGRARLQLALVILAWQQALARRVGATEGAARLAAVWQIQADGSELLVFDSESGNLVEHHPWLEPPIELPESASCTLHLLTPLRIQQQGKPLRGRQLTARDLLIALARRISLLAEFHADWHLALPFTELSRQAEEVTVSGHLSWRDWTRWSCRQEQEMVLGGVVGHWSLHGDLAPFWDLLYLGQWLHAGKNATFGLGHYRLQV
ncbi:MAG: CRISPR system precrRNA processing endoribonuclease RAMP protein Cas6 [Magnetococcales bacterium]|nr:CRISPR system precrRNA processing endoribonuclease RAMP protein Cas6 [Magnetococcales bacterium]